ncbi:MAG: HAMP domain-containing sensor histidine kinase [Candidatus Nanopelagicales bacterium]
MTVSGGSRAGTRQLRRSALMLGVQSGVVVALVVLVLVVTALVVVLRSQHTSSVELLQQAVVRADDVRDPPTGTWLSIRSAGGVVSSPGMPKGLPDAGAMTEVARSGQPISGGANVGGKDFLVYTELRDAVVVQGVLDLSADHAERDRLVSALLLAGLLGLVLAVLSGLALARRALRPLATTVALQRRFVADASHELRTPLTLLSTRAQLVRRDLRRGMDAAAVAREIDGLVADTDNLALVLEDLLIAVDPRSVGPDVAVDLDDVSSDVVAAFDRAEGRDHQVSVVCRRAGAPVWVTGAPTALRRAVTAVVDNAVRHADREVVVSVASTGTHGVVEVSDDGPGIEAQMLPRLFERHESAAGEDGGRRSYGLGLALVSDIVARHGGTIAAHNGDPAAGQPRDGRPGHDQPGYGQPGAVLTLTLPLAPGS